MGLDSERMKAGRATRWLIGAALVVTALLAAAVALRTPLAERAAAAYLTARGFPGASVSVSRIGLDGAVVDHLALGPALPSVGRIELRYRLADLVGLRLGAVRIDGLRAVVDGRDPTALTRLERLLPPGGGSKDAAAVPVAKVEISDARIMLRDTGGAEVTVAFHGSLDLAPSPARASLEGQAHGDFGQVSLTLRVDDLFGRPAINISGRGEADLARLPWPERLDPQPQGGAVQFSFAGRLPAPSPGGPGLAGLLADGGVMAVDLNVREAALLPYAASVDASASLTARTGGDALVVRLERPATLTARGLPDALRRSVETAEFSLDASAPPGSDDRISHGTMRVAGRLTEDRLDATVRGEAFWRPDAVAGLSADVALDLRASGIALADSRVHSLAWRGDGILASGSASVAGPLTARLDVLGDGAPSAEDLAIEGELGISGAPGETITLTLREGGAEISSPPVFGGLRMKGPVRVAIPSAHLTRAPDGRITAEARLLPQGLNATVALEDDRRTDISASIRAIEVSLRSARPVAGRLRLLGGVIRVPAAAILAERVEAAIPFPLGPDGEPAVLSATVSTASGRLAPLAVEARVTAEGDAFLVTGSIGTPDGSVRIPLRARALGTGARGSIAFGPASLEFRPNALQPRALGSALAAVTRAEGTLDVSGALAFAPDMPLEGQADVAFRDLSVETAMGAIEHLNGTIRLDGLFPPRTAGKQTLSARRLEAGLPLEEPSLQFHVDATEAGSVVMIERAEGGIAEGLISVEGARFDPAAARNAFVIGIEGLSLARLLDEYAMEGLSGTGTLSGVIPVTFSDAGMTIESGTARAEGGGVLRLDWGSSRDVMMAQGEQVALMAQVLEDFHYSSLRLTIDRPAADSLSLRATLEGHNPAVRDGHPVHFNISLSGELEKIVAAIAEGRRLETSLFRGGFGGVP